MRFDNRVALITGGGTGIGRGISELLACEGARVAVNYSHSADAAHGLVAAIRELGGSAIAVQADVSTDSGARDLIARVIEEFGALDLLVNNAGWSTRVPHDRLDGLTDEIWDHTLNTNLRGAFYCSRAAVAPLRERAGSSIVNIASVAGFTGMGSSIVYAASKAAMLSMTKSLARALAPGIRVNAVAPGFVRTRFASWPAQAFDDGEAQTPIQRLATPEDIAGATLFLATARAITGETIIVDGGTTQLGPRPKTVH